MVGKMVLSVDGLQEKWAQFQEMRSVCGLVPWQCFEIGVDLEGVIVVVDVVTGSCRNELTLQQG